MEGAIVIRPGEGEMLERAGAGSHRVLAELAEFEAIELSFEPGWEGVAPHTHDDHVDSFYVLEGEVEFAVGEQTVHGGPGTYVAVPQGVVHGFGNAGAGRIRVLNVHAPRVGFIDRLRDG
ncbi:MAG: cupin domain-containing protein [Gemmatimonadales bacterium]